MSRRLIVCDDNKNMRAFLQWIINAHPDLELVAEGESGAQAVALCRTHRPDLMLIDVQMDSANDGIDAIAEIRRFDSEVKIIVLTVYSDDNFVINAFRNGANNFLLKDTSAPEILRAIEDTLEDNEVLSQMVAKKLRNYVARSASMVQQPAQQKDIRDVMQLMNAFTRTEQEILTLLHEGYTRKEISAQKVIEPVTVKAHISNILRKVKLHRMDQVLSYLEEIGYFSYFNDIHS